MSRCRNQFHKREKVFLKNCDETERLEQCFSDRCRQGDCRNIFGENCDENQDVCVHAPCKDPALLTLLVNAVFDESGLNLCQTDTITAAICREDYEKARSISLNVISIDVSESSLDYLKDKPNCVRIRLADLIITFEAKVFDACGDLLTTFLFESTFLSENPVCSYRTKEQGLSSICTDLYAPYGISYDGCDPVIHVIAFSEGEDHVAAGIHLQATAKVLKLCKTGSDAATDFRMTIGLTLLLRSVYTVEYKFQHAGSSMPPKARAVEQEEDHTCERFLAGDLLMECAKPFEADKDQSDGICVREI